MAIDMKLKQTARVRHILWVNDHGAPVGGCERYIRETAELLQARGIRSSLIYQVDGELDADYLKVFDGAYPCVDPELQIAEIAPDFIYVHRLSGVGLTEAFSSSAVPAARFIHDHKLFCLREHKYTTLGHHTCTRPIGAHCYSCLGFVNRSEQWPGVRLSRLGTLRAEQRANQDFDAFILGSSYMRGHIVQHGFSPEHSYVIPLYAFPKERDQTIAREPGLLLFAGQLLRGKGLDLLLTALATSNHDDARLVVAGSGHQEAMYRQQCHDLGLDERVEFVGRVDSDTLDTLMQRASALIFPSRAPETFGLAGVEAMRFGTPVIATAVGGVPDWLRDGENGFMVPSGDAEALGAAIDRLLGRPEMQQQMQLNALRRYEKDFRPEAHVDRLIDVFERVAEAAC